jgi:hypothetical protein
VHAASIAIRALEGPCSFPNAHHRRPLPPCVFDGSKHSQTGRSAGSLLRHVTFVLREFELLMYPGYIMDILNSRSPRG